jgi:hypothetical protein
MPRKASPSHDASRNLYSLRLSGLKGCLVFNSNLSQHKTLFREYSHLQIVVGISGNMTLMYVYDSLGEFVVNLRNL